VSPGSYRDPARGFLSIRGSKSQKHYAANDCAGELRISLEHPGDVMHFNDNDRHSDYMEYGEKNLTSKRRGGG